MHISESLGLGQPVNPSANQHPDTEVLFRPLAFANTTGIFILMGAMTSLFGPLLVEFSRHFSISPPSAGDALSIYFVGAFLGVLPGWLGLKRVAGRLVLSFALITIAVGAAGASLSQNWTWFLVSVFLIGLGFGSLDIALNTLLARTAIRGRAFRLSVGNAGYGVGAVICPLLIIVIHPRNFPALFIGFGVVAVILSSMNKGVHAPPLHTETKQHQVSTLKTQRRPILVTFVVAYILYVAIETVLQVGWQPNCTMSVFPNQ